MSVDDQAAEPVQPAPTEPVRRLKDLPSTHLLGSGTPMCAGCGGLAAVREIYDLLGRKTVFINTAGCMTLLAVYPFTPFRGSWLFTAMASGAAGAQGVRDALDMLQQKQRLPADQDLQVVVLSGDGSAYGMGLSATSAAIERDLDFIFICYDNEGYGNTGQQASPGTPHAARTATSRGPQGYAGEKKDLFAIWAAHRPTYAATVVASDPVDMAKKIQRASQLKGPRLLLALAPCPTGWDFAPSESVEIGKLAIETGIWPLKEYVDGEIRHTRLPKDRRPVRQYLERQGRFAHLFQPNLQQHVIDEIQAKVDTYWGRISASRF